MNLLFSGGKYAPTFASTFETRNYLNVFFYFTFEILDFFVRDEDRILRSVAPREAAGSDAGGRRYGAWNQKKEFTPPVPPRAAVHRCLSLACKSGRKRQMK